MKTKFIGAILSVAMVAGIGMAHAQLTDPATLHVGGTAAQAQGSGADPNIITGNDFYIYQESGGMAAATNAPLDIIISSPDFGQGSAFPVLGTATLNGSTPVSTTSSLSAFGLGTYTQGSLFTTQDVYTFLGLSGAGVDASNNITNFDAAEAANGITGVKGYDVYVFEANTAFNPKDLLAVLNNTITSGSFIDAYSRAADDTPFVTAFTNAGLTLPPSPVPEPASLAILGTALVGMGIALRNRRRRA